MTTKLISATSTIIWGIIITLILILLFFLVISIFPLNISKSGNITICLAFPLIVFLSGFTTVESAQTGLLNILGARMKTTISEGIVWLPPFTSLTIFDAKEQSVDIGETEILSTNQISIKLKISFNWRIVDNYQVSNLNSNVLEKGLTELIKNEVRNEILQSKFNDVDSIKSDKIFIKEILSSCNKTAENKWGILITELFISAIRPATENMTQYYESKAKIDEIVEHAALISKKLNITPKEALDKYARERLKVSSIEYIYSLNEISKITSLIEKLLNK